MSFSDEIGSVLKMSWIEPREEAGIVKHPADQGLTVNPQDDPPTPSIQLKFSAQISDPFIFWFSHVCLKKKKWCILKTETDVRSNFLLEVTKYIQIWQDMYFTYYKISKIVIKQIKEELDSRVVFLWFFCSFF